MFTLSVACNGTANCANSTANLGTIMLNSLPSTAPTGLTCSLVSSTLSGTNAIVAFMVGTTPAKAGAAAVAVSTAVVAGTFGTNLVAASTLFASTGPSGVLFQACPPSVPGCSLRFEWPAPLLCKDSAGPCRRRR